MKKLATILCLSALATAVYAQGTVNFLNGSYALTRTNATAIGGTSGTTATAAGGFYYGLFTAPSTVHGVGSVLDVLSGWTFTGLYGTNIAATGRLSGGSNIPTQQGWAPGETNSFVVVGWSSNFGRDWAAVASALAGGTYNSNYYNLPRAPQNLDRNAYIGVSSGWAFGAAGGGLSGLPAFALWATGASAQGTPITTGIDLYVVQVPEPTSFALAGLGAAALLIFRRRK